MDRLPGFRLGEIGEPVQMETMDHHRLAALQMVQQARRTIEIASRLLDPPVYDTPEFIEAVKQLVLTNRRARVRILVWEPLQVVQNGHRLVDVAGHLTTFFEMRKPGIEHREYNGSLLIADEVGYISRASAERYEGMLNFNDRRVTRNLLDEFELMWSRSTPDPNLRKMII